MEELRNVQFAVLATDGFEEAELTEPVRALREAKARAVIIAPHGGRIYGFRHHDKSCEVEVELTLDRAEPDAFDGLVLPGGALNADAMRVDPRVHGFIRVMQNGDKPIAAICHAPWELISAGVMRGRRLTSYHTIQDDIRNAGGNWVDQEVVVDRNWITSRQPSDIPAFNRELLLLTSQVSRSAAKAVY